MTINPFKLWRRHIFNQRKHIDLVSFPPCAIFWKTTELRHTLYNIVDIVDYSMFYHDILWNRQLNLGEPITIAMMRVFH